MTKEALAEQLHCREIGNEITRDEAKRAKECGLLVVYGASDDLCEMAGAFRDEVGAPGSITISRNGHVVPALEDDDIEVLERHGVLAQAKVKRLMGVNIEALWCAEKNGPAWTYKTEEPHATFDIMEDGEVYCRGIVIDMGS